MAPLGARATACSGRRWLLGVRLPSLAVAPLNAPPSPVVAPHGVPPSLVVSPLGVTPLSDGGSSRLASGVVSPSIYCFLICRYSSIMPSIMLLLLGLYLSFSSFLLGLGVALLLSCVEVPFLL